MKEKNKNIKIFFSYFIYIILFELILEFFHLSYVTLSPKYQILYNIASNALYLIFLIIILRKELFEELKDFKKNFKTYISKNIVIYLIGIALMVITTIIISKITNQSVSGNELQIRSFFNKFPLLTVVLALFLSPPVEEIVFRRSMKGLFKNKYLFIIISSILFGLLHVYTFKSLTEILFSIPYMIMGACFAYVYERTNNIFTSICMHIVYNLIFILILLF